MKTPDMHKISLKMPVVIFMQIISLLLAFLCGAPVSAEDTKTQTISGVSREEALRLGERMYRQGILPSGEPMKSLVKGDIPVEGKAFTCANCHQRSGLGSYEGSVYTPPTSGEKLFQPLKMSYKGIEVSSASLRPAYTDESLAEVLRGGTDPSGRKLDEVMPRYLLGDEDMAILVFYLKSLSSQFSPGVTDTTLSFAIVISDNVSPQDRDAMLAPLEKYFTLKNNQAKAYERSPRQARMAETMVAASRETAYKRLSLSRWILTGPPETWRSQLEEYNRREPVFALLGGIVSGEWKPIHQFSEDNHIPCLFPNTDLPVISENDWYTLYLSKGFYQEGEAAARYLNSVKELIKGKPIVQIVRDSREGHALSTGFEETWRDLGQKAPVTVTLKAGETATDDLLQQILAKELPAAVIIWDGPGVLSALDSLASLIMRPAIVFVSSRYLGDSLWTLKEEVRDFTYITYPYRLPNDKPISSMGSIINFQVDNNVLAQQTYSLIQVLTMSLMDMRGNYYRDNFFDVIAMIMDQAAPLYERLSFGPGQRYASKGCYVVQLSKGKKPELIRRSDWVIH